MSKYIIRFITSEDQVNIQLESDTVVYFEQTEFVNDLWNCTTVDRSAKSHCFVLQVSADLKALYAQLQKKYGKAYPKFNAVVALLNRTTDGKTFTVVFNEEWNVYKSTQLNCIIEEIEGGQKAKDNYEDIMNLFGDVLSHYRFIAADSSKFHRIGEQDRKKRVCRFCGRKMPETTFASDSHTISEALGNKNFITNDECDECNSRFGKGAGIENDLLNMHAPLITMLGVKGKKHIPEFNGKDFELGYKAAVEEGGNPTIDLRLVVDDALATKTEKLDIVRLESDKRVVPQNVYRTLCKYAIGMLPSKDVPFFSETIKWINGEFDIPKLPKVKFWLMQQRAVHPELTIVIRHSTDTSLPFAYAEFSALCFKYIYIIPLANDEKTDFTLRQNYDRWWNFLTYAQNFPWREDDLSSIVSRKMTFRFNFHKQNTNN